MLDKLLGKNVFVLGLGKSGMGAVRELKKHGVHVIAWDEKEELRAGATRMGAQIISPGEFDFRSAALLVLSPSIHHKHPAFVAAGKAGIPVVSDIELFVTSRTENRFIGITGTNGKSTTTALAHHILSENKIPSAIGGNFGIAVFDMPKLPRGGWYVLELSSYQLELTPGLDLDIAALLNITADHIDHHGSMQAYMDAKMNIFHRARKKRYTNVVAVDDEYTKAAFKELAKDTGANNIPVSFERKTPGLWVNIKGVLMDGARELLDTTKLPELRGKHNRQNIAVAFAIARAAGVPDKGIISAISTFKTLDHRMQKVGELDGVEFVNDSKATNADSAYWALTSFDDIYWIIGGRAKEGGISSLAPLFKEGRIKRAFTIGECGKDFYNATKRDIDTYRCGKLSKAVAKAFKLAVRDLKKGRVTKPVILLSPATASFDQYKCFEERGEHFKRLFEEMRRP